MLLWTCGIRVLGIVLALAMGAIIVRKMKQWDDPALLWLLAGLSIGPIVVLAANIVLRAFLGEEVSPVLRIAGLGNIQVRFLYEIANNVLNIGCAAVALIGAAKLYSRVKERYVPMQPEELSTIDPRS
jgi:hypothetical protein